MDDCTDSHQSGSNLMLRGGGIRGDGKVREPLRNNPVDASLSHRLPNLGDQTFLLYKTNPEKKTKSQQNFKPTCAGFLGAAA